MSSIITKFAVFLVRLYWWTISPAKVFFFGPMARCRFQPSCSDYAIEALGAHGPISGGWLALKRICRCHPWGGCGHDPVPLTTIDHAIRNTQHAYPSGPFNDLTI